MNKSRLEEKRKAVNNLLENHGFKKNSYGIYHNGMFKADTRKTSLKLWHGQYKLESVYLKNVDIQKLNLWLMNRIK